MLTSFLLQMLCLKYKYQVCETSLLLHWTTQPLALTFVHQNSESIPLLPMHAVCPDHIFLLHLTTQIISGQKHQS